MMFFSILTMALMKPFLLRIQWQAWMLHLQPQMLWTLPIQIELLDHSVFTPGGIRYPAKIVLRRPIRWHVAGKTFSSQWEIYWNNLQPLDSGEKDVQIYWFWAWLMMVCKVQHATQGVHSVELASISDKCKCLNCFSVHLCLLGIHNISSNAVLVLEVKVFEVANHGRFML